MTDQTPNPPAFREHTCANGHTWRAFVAFNAATPRLSGERRAYCPTCTQPATNSAPWTLENGSPYPFPDPAPPDPAHLSLAAFIDAAGLSMRCERTDANPHMDPESARTMDHWTCVLHQRRDRRTSFRLTFSQGFGHNGHKPELASVLNCLASDAASIEQARSFEEWASELGYDTDSRRAWQTWQAVEKQAQRLKRFLGDASYTTLLYGTERL